MTDATSKQEGQNQQEEEDVKVVLTQNLLRVEETFVYKIPPMKTSGGHRAEDWNLAKPLATTALNLIRRDNALLIQLMGRRAKPGGPPGATEEHLFAQARIVIEIDAHGRSTRTVEYWVESVVDSSRYFVIRCEDEKTNRQAFVGIGFRERNDAMNFKMGISDFIRAMEREKKALEMSASVDDDANKDATSGDGEAGDVVPAVSKLSLKEGEKIHVDLGKRARPRKKPFDASLSGSTGKVVGAGGLLLRRPPPPAGEEPKKEEKQKDETALEGDGTETCKVAKDDDKAAASANGTGTGTDTAFDTVDEDEDWGDFESG